MNAASVLPVSYQPKELTITLSNEAFVMLADSLEKFAGRPGAAAETVTARGAVIAVALIF